jgi:cytochrome c biogenesis factor
VTDPEGRVYDLAPGFTDRRDQERELQEVSIGTTGMNLALSGIDTRTGRGTLQIVRPPLEAVWVEASIKPFIVLLWFGTGLVMLGMAISTVYRAMAKSQPSTKNSSVGKRKLGAA